MKIKMTKGLSLNKEAITKLQDSQLTQFKGGVANNSDLTCGNGSCIKSCNKNSCKPPTNQQ